MRDELMRLIESSQKRVEKAEPKLPKYEPPEELVEEVIEWLASEQAEASLHRDPYWPKWDSPWWHMVLLDEMGLADEIPQEALDAMTQRLDAHYLHYFPLVESEVPPGIDTHRQVMCHCAHAIQFRILAYCGVDVDEALPWMRPWLLKYQMADGGLNCDETAYTKPSPHASITSTVPAVEAMLHATDRDFTEAEEAFVDRAVRYMLDRKLCRSLSKAGAYMDEGFLLPSFPRFYEYDVLRGLQVVVDWAQFRNEPLPAAAILEAAQAVDKAMLPDGLLPPRRSILDINTLWPQDDGTWKKGVPATRFALLDAVSRVDAPSPYLTQQWSDVLFSLTCLDESGQIGP